MVSWGTPPQPNGKKKGEHRRKRRGTDVHQLRLDLRSISIRWSRSKDPAPASSFIEARLNVGKDCVTTVDIGQRMASIDFTPPRAWNAIASADPAARRGNALEQLHTYHDFTLTLKLMKDKSTEIGRGSFLIDEVFSQPKVFVNVPIVNASNNLVCIVSCHARTASMSARTYWRRLFFRWLRRGTLASMVGFIAYSAWFSDDGDLFWHWIEEVRRVLMWIIVAAQVPLIPMVALLVSPQLFGYFVTHVMMPKALPGLKASIAEFSVQPWVQKGAINFLISGRRAAIENPPGYPHQHAAFCDWFQVWMRMSFTSFLNGPRVPTVWNGDLELEDIEESPPPRFGQVHFEFIELNGCHANAEVNRRGELNALGLERMKGEHILRKHLGDRSLWPNTLQVRVIQARNLENDDYFSPFADPWAQVSLRNYNFRTVTTLKTLNPIWNGKLWEMHIEDPSAVLHLQVFDEDISSDTFMGQWSVQLLQLIKNPDTLGPGQYLPEAPLEYEEDGFVTFHAPLWNQHFSAMNGGEVRIQLRWYRDRKNEVPVPIREKPLAQISQLQQESALKKLNPQREQMALNAMPYLFHVNRLTLRHIRINWKDVFAGHSEKAQTKSSAQRKVLEIESMEFGKNAFKSFDGNGLGMYDLQKRLTDACVGKVSKDHHVLFNAVTNFVYSSLKRTWKGGHEEDVAFAPTDAGQANRPPRRTIAGRIQNHVREAWNLHSVLAKQVRGQNPDWVKEAKRSARMQKTHHAASSFLGRQWRDCQVELKGSTLFYTHIDDETGQAADWTRKLELPSAESIWIDYDNEEIVIVCRIGTRIIPDLVGITKDSADPSKNKVARLGTHTKARYFRFTEDPENPDQKHGVDELRAWLRDLQAARLSKGSEGDEIEEAKRDRSYTTDHIRDAPSDLGMAGVPGRHQIAMSRRGSFEAPV